MDESSHGGTHCFYIFRSIVNTDEYLYDELYSTDRFADKLIITYTDVIAGGQVVAVAAATITDARRASNSTSHRFKYVVRQYYSSSFAP